MMQSEPRPSTCRSCNSLLQTTFLDLGVSPLCQSQVAPGQLNQMEPFYPLHVMVCDTCLLVQLDEFVTPAEIFSEYAYFSSYSTSWVDHARRYVHAMVDRFHLNDSSRVIEVASNDGYLLQHFVELGIPVLGIDPAANVTAVAESKGIPCLTRFFGKQTAEEVVQLHGTADLLLGNNVLAHVPDINDFVRGLKILLSADGVITMEFPHLQRLMANNQFDTIYHEHFSYLSLMTVEAVFERHGLTIFDVEELSTHGGSLRIFARHSGSGALPLALKNRVAELRAREIADGFATVTRYSEFQERVRGAKRGILSFLIDAKQRGKRIAGYGAPGKGNTLLNYCGIRTDFIDFTVDANPYKQGSFTPGTRIPIRHPDEIRRTRPDYVFILPWNLADEISQAHSYIREWGGQFVVPIPEVRVF